eukprot:TRINITY_DN52577_c0_g1_i1.p1 TRINITY_DN52577_c0_g1~~TRINITY_DN52577_c0_g1_i1.p1  ORF type:complete len:233 (+),score=60.05 TRINITY_DN52577_c0_g1_i1:75-773(+)
MPMTRADAFRAAITESTLAFHKTEEVTTKEVLLEIKRLVVCFQNSVAIDIIDLLIEVADVETPLLGEDTWFAMSTPTFGAAGAQMAKDTASFASLEAAAVALAQAPTTFVRPTAPKAPPANGFRPFGAMRKGPPPPPKKHCKLTAARSLLSETANTEVKAEPLAAYPFTSNGQSGFSMASIPPLGSEDHDEDGYRSTFDFVADDSGEEDEEEDAEEDEEEDKEEEEEEEGGR